MPKTKASLLVLAATAITVATLFLLPFTPKVAVRTAVVERGALSRTTLLEGIVSYQDEQPCVSYQAGRVSAVHVRQGQRVHAGDLLFSMDTSAEEAALASISQMLYEQEKLLSGFERADALAAAVLQSTWDARKTEGELRASIASKQVRAAADGVVAGVYADAGDYVPALSVLGAVRGENRCVTAVNRVGGAVEAIPGTVADIKDASGKQLGLATLVSMGVPQADTQTSQYVQTLTFLPSEDGALAQAEIGGRVTVEMLLDSSAGATLAPVAAVGKGDRVWIVANGVASPVEIDVSRRNEQYVSVPETLAGQRVILLPDEYALYAGCSVKEAKKR